jgi:hypothetical protein
MISHLEFNLGAYLPKRYASNYNKATIIELWATIRKNIVDKINVMLKTKDVEILAWKYF